MNQRFSKAKLLAAIRLRRNELELQYDFDPGNGYAQVRGKGEEINHAYGEYDGLARLRTYLDLD